MKKALRRLGIAIGSLVAFYVVFVIVFEAVYLGWMQPSFEESGIPMLVLTTQDDDGNEEERRLARIMVDNKIYVSAHHWPRGWYDRAIANPNVRVQIDDSVADYTAVPVDGEEFERVAAAFPLPTFVRFLMGFPPAREIARLDPAVTSAST